MIILYERNPELLFPLSRIRPVWDLRVGAQTLHERAVRAFPDDVVSHVGRPAVSEAWRHRHEVVPGAPSSGTRLLDAGVALTPVHARALSALSGPARLVDGADRFVGVWNAPEPVTVPISDAGFDALEVLAAAWPTVPLNEAASVCHPHDFIRQLDRLLIGDADWYQPTPAIDTPGVRVLGDGVVHLHPDATVDPGTTLDTRGGPIVIAAGANVSFGTWLAGPALIGEGTRLLGGTVGPLVGIGPNCRIRGEVAETFVHGHSNKAHDGFIGHTVVGEWVNLGAMTSCSDLKNNYGNVRLDLPGGVVDTGLTKFGILAGDHVKAAIGTMFNTGTVIDTAANVFGGGGLTPKSIAAFAWGRTGEAGSYGVERFLVTARRVMARRGVEMDAGTEALLRELHVAARSGSSG